MPDHLKMIRKRRLEKELTLQQMADRIGVSRTSYYRYETGQRDFGMDNLYKVFQALGFAPNDMTKFFLISVPKSERKAS